MNGEAIYGTRVWTRFGEGPNPQNLDEEHRIKREAVGDWPWPVYTGHDFRFTTKGDALYAIAMSWPGPEALITSLAQGRALVGKIKSIRLLGHNGALEFAQGTDGLRVKLPAEKAGKHAFVLKITGLKLK